MEHCTQLQEHVAGSGPVTTLLRYDVDGRITLAGQPQPNDWSALAAEGFTTIINMRSDPERAAVEAENARQAGLAIVHLPLPAYELESEHVEQFTKVVEAANGRLMIHCRTASRVALLWMLHRMQRQGWSQDAAEAELRRIGYDEDSMEVFQFCTEDYLERTETAVPSA